MIERWEQVTADDLPGRFTDPACAEFRSICSNGWEWDLSIGAAFMHKPKRWPQCFPDGEDGECCCTLEFIRMVRA